MSPIDWRDHCPVYVGGIVIGHARVTLEDPVEPDTTDGREIRAPRHRRLVADVWPSSDTSADGFRVIEGEPGVVFFAGGIAVGEVAER
jgi:hypothetical protein